MYNLLVTAEEDAWEHTTYKYYRNRFLEYTNQEIADKFRHLDSDNIETLKKYPCLFAYEGGCSPIKIGYITEVEITGSLLQIEYRFESIPEIQFSDIAQFLDALDIRNWEMSRTHWAIKNKDLFNIISTLVPQNYTPVQIPITTEAPVQEQNYIASVQSFIDVIFQDAFDSSTYELFYRGHSDLSYKLVPSLFRTDQEGNYLYLDKEEVLYRELIISNSSDFASENYTLDKLVKMQHYSLPTRLLDISSNPLIALYFACLSKQNENGEVILFAVKRDEIKYYDSDTASCISNLVKLSKNQKKQIDFSLSQAAFNEHAPIKRLLHHIKEEKSFFIDSIEPNDLQRVICVKSKQSNDRISFQSGAFFLFGIDAILDENGTPEVEVKRILIQKEAKNTILKELDRLNINESTVFPYIENSAKYIAQKHQFKKD